VDLHSRTPSDRDISRRRRHNGRQPGSRLAATLKQGDKVEFAIDAKTETITDLKLIGWKN